ncbi:MAG TPA: hypothetical protein VE152_00740 [Acidimicrobiales bacterium]|nr:hypothetical protein [Acidimicrobiales bacterium]
MADDRRPADDVGSLERGLAVIRAVDPDRHHLTARRWPASPG